MVIRSNIIEIYSIVIELCIEEIREKGNYNYYLLRWSKLMKYNKNIHTFYTKSRKQPMTD